MIEFIAVLVIGSSVGVLVDAARIGVRKGRVPGFFDMGPVGWFFSCLLCWIIGFPAYIARRGDYLTAANAEKQEPAPIAKPARSVGHRVLRGLGIVTASIVLGMALVVGALVVHSMPGPSALASTAAQSGAVSMVDYSQIQDGMTLRQVLTIIGRPGEELSRSTIGNVTTVMYSWKNSNGASMNAIFQDDRLVSKAQFGLR